ncbi:hypothetical protein J2W56_006118 [Nocardia kruczakiae]|uniref:Uncharacterized protein n=1 Tax=Nocardia kruczakiae TaxID=261477 RepID=A0ABU1XP66_9NOCA|nr:hypothetical protein [Nocardia kruczakiae]
MALPFENQAPWKNEYDREQAAWSRLSSTILTGVTIGTLVGGLGGILAIGALGTAAGQLFVTAPAAVQYFTTVSQPAPSAK